MRSILLLVILVFTSQLSWAQTDYVSSCSPWVKVKNTTCPFADKNSDYEGSRWVRECPYETICKNRGYEYGPCEADKICVLKGQNPNDLTTACTEWKPRHDVECVNGKMSWIRACQMSGVGYPDSTCSDSYPQE